MIITFVNRYCITLAADMFVPQNAEGRLPTIVVFGPFGAVKEQVSGRYAYAQGMAERRFLGIAFDPSFTGESGGTIFLTLTGNSFYTATLRSWYI